MNPQKLKPDLSLIGITGNGARQDAVIWGNRLIWFTGNNNRYSVFDLDSKSIVYEGAIPGDVNPHVNVACFGSPSDLTGDIPPLYLTGYNGTESGIALPAGTCFVYQMDENYALTPIQKIRLDSDFISSQEWSGVRTGKGIIKYGNFVVDTDKERLYVITTMGTRAKLMTKLFVFAIPALTTTDVILSGSDVLESYELPVYMWLQGACYDSGRLYLACGIDQEMGQTAGLAIIDTHSFSESAYVALSDYMSEPEMVVTYNGKVLVGQNAVYEVKAIPPLSLIGHSSMGITEFATLRKTMEWHLLGRDRQYRVMLKEDIFNNSINVFSFMPLFGFAFVSINAYVPASLVAKTKIASFPDDSLPVAKYNIVVPGELGSVFTLECLNTGEIFLTRNTEANQNEWIRALFAVPLQN